MASSADWWSRRLSGPPTAQPTASPRPAPTAAPVTYDASSGQAVPDDGFMSVLANAAAATGGSKQVKENSSRCPECGSGNFFAQRRTENGMPMRVEAAARCFDCGYPILQAGSMRGGAATAKSDGPSKRARQLPKGHAITVVDGGGTHTFNAS